MNYYPFHLGDYAAHTAHLEPMEDLAYRRMLDLYYRSECPLPASVEDLARLLRLRDHEATVRDVLNEFFTLAADGWRHCRCDEEIARMQDKQAKAKASAAASVNARAANAKRTLNERSANVELPTPTPTPTENNSAHTADTLAQIEAEGHQPTAAGLACRAIRQAGIADVNPGHPNLARLLEAGVKADELAATAAELVGKRKGSFALLLATVEGRRRDAASAGDVPAVPDRPLNTDAEKTARALAEDRAREERLKSPEGRRQVAQAIEAAKRRLTGAAA